MPDPRSFRPSQGVADHIPEPAMEAIHDLARYARSRRLEDADRLLAEIMAILSQGIEKPSPRARLRSECRAMRVLRSLREAPPEVGRACESSRCRT